MTRPTTEARGEFDIELAGVTYGMRPSHEAIDAFERSTDMAKLELARAAMAGSLKSWQVAEIVTECVRAWGRATRHPDAPQFNVKRVAELLAGANMIVLNEKLKVMLFLAVSGGLEPSGEAKATMATATPPAAPQSSAGSPAPRSAGRRTNGGKPRR